MLNQEQKQDGFASTSSSQEYNPSTDSVFMFGDFREIDQNQEQYNQNSHIEQIQNQDEPMWCVKVFGFNGEDSWVDMGTGITCLEIVPAKNDEEQKKMILTVSNNLNDPNVAMERDPNVDETKRQRFRGASNDVRTILQVDLTKGLGFNKQNQTIISWYQPDIEEDLAISFLDQWDCLSTYVKICNELELEYTLEICIPNKDN